MQIEQSTILPGGWHYKEEGYRIPHKGELPNAKEVVDQLLKYRLENNIDVGDPEGDLENYVCAHFPPWCRRGFNAPLPPKQEPNQRNVDLVVGWANRFYTTIGRLTLITQKEADQRAQICEHCPMQMNWVQDCPPCVTSAQRLLLILRQGKDTALGNQGLLKGCACYGWDNRTAVHLDPQHLPTADAISPLSPPNCWVRSLQR